jgi:hypothetical protein
MKSLETQLAALSYYVWPGLSGRKIELEPAAMWQATYRAPKSCGLPASTFLRRYVLRFIYKKKIPRQAEEFGYY